MSDEITVKVNSYGPGRPLSLVYFDPVTGKKKAQSSGTSDWRDAERQAGELEKELRAGRYAAPSKVTWEQFVTRYTDEKLSSLAPSTMETAKGSLSMLKQLLDPDRLSKVTAAMLSRFASELRKPRKITKGERAITRPAARDTTIAHHLRHIKAALRWAESVGMITKAPKVTMPHRAKGQTMSRSRAVTTEEYERILAAVPKVRPNDSAAWERFIKGLWLSGLRLSEGTALSWDEGSPFSVDLLGRRPALRIQAAAQKSGRDEVLPVTPDFAAFLLQTPEAERVGPVFPLADQYGMPIAPRNVGVIVSKIGRKAKVVTNKADGKFAGCHDLRRAFGTRWARRVMPAILKRLMRHSSVTTTMSYYVDLQAADVADELWAKFGDTDGNSGPAVDCGNTFGNNGAKTDAQPVESK